MITLYEGTRIMEQYYHICDKCGKKSPITAKPIKTPDRWLGLSILDIASHNVTVTVCADCHQHILWLRAKAGFIESAEL